MVREVEGGGRGTLAEGENRMAETDATCSSGGTSGWGGAGWGWGNGGELRINGEEGSRSSGSSNRLRAGRQGKSKQ